MDLGLLFILLFGSAWLYGALVLAVVDARWNLNRIVGSAGLALLSAALIATRRTGPEWLLLTALLFLLTALMPRLLRKYVGLLLAQGRLRAALLWQALAGPPALRLSPAQREELERVNALHQSLDPHGPGPERRAGTLARVASAPSRRAFHAAELEAAALRRDYDFARALIEDVYGPDGLPPDSPSLYTAAIVLAESNRPARALAALRRAEERLVRADPADLRRFLAFLHVYASCGSVADVERLINLNPRAVTRFPAALPSYWRGLALARADRPIEAAGAFVDAVALTEPGEEALRRHLQRRMSAPPPPLPAGALGAGAAEDLDVVRRFEGRPWTLPASLFAPRRVLVSWILVALCLAMFALTEFFGSSTATNTLVRFGANVSELVRQGEWWRLMSGVFLHVGVLHLLFNVYACFLLGAFVERLVGRWEMFAAFLISGVGGSAASAFLGANAVSAGASGAVFGLLGAATIIVLRFRSLLPADVRRMQLLNFLFIAAINMLYGLLEPRIDNFAHGGGFAAGALTALLFAPPHLAQRRRLFFRAVGGILIGVMLVVAGHAANHARAHGPTRVPLVAWRAPAGAWAVHVPARWHAEKREPFDVLFSDPYGAALGVAVSASAPRHDAFSPAGSGSPRRQDALGRGWEESVTVIPERDVRVVRRQLRLAERNRAVTLVYEYDRDEARYYEPLLERLLAGVETAD